MVRRWLCLCVVAAALVACGHRADSPANILPRILLLHEDIDSIGNATPAQIQFYLEQEIRNRLDVSLTQLAADTLPTSTTPPTPATPATPVAQEVVDIPDIVDANTHADDALSDAVLFDSPVVFSIPGHLSLECAGVCQNATLSGDIAIAVDNNRRGFALENIHLQDIDAQFILRGNIKRFLDDERIFTTLAEAELMLETPYEQIIIDTEASLTIDAIPQSQSDDAYGLIELSHHDSNTILSGAYSSLAPPDGG